MPEKSPHSFLNVIIVSIMSLLFGICTKNNPVDHRSVDGRPSPPEKVTAVPGRGQVTITWDTAGDAESFNLYWANRKNVTFDANVIGNAVSPFKHTGLNSDSTYYYRLSAVKDSGESELSNEVMAKPLPLSDIPGEVGNIQVTAGDKKIMIAWDTIPGATRYAIYWSDSPAVNKNSAKISDVTTPFIHDNLTNGTMYYYRVSAGNDAGESELSTTKYAVPTPATTVPNPPTNIKIYERDSLLTFTWDPVVNATLFNVYWSYGSTVTKANNREIATTTPFDLMNLENDEKIYIRISSQNDIGEGQLSVTYSAVPAPLAPPESLEVSVSYRRVTLSWDSVSNATSYNLYWLPYGSDNTTQRKISNVTSPFVHDSLDPSVNYRYTITSANPFEESSRSAPALAKPKLIPPDELVATGGYKENRLVWSGVPHVPAYLVYWRTGSGKDTLSGSEVCSTSSFTHSDLPLNTRYNYKVYSKDGDSLSVGYSGKSATTILDKPTADAGNDMQVTRGDTIRLHGIGRDSLGTIVKYEWKIIGNQEWLTTSSGDTVIVTPDTVHSFVCTLKVTDNDGVECVDEVKIVIASDPPKASLQANPAAAGFNDAVTFTVVASDSGRIQSYSMKFGDNDWIGVSGNDTTVRTPSVAGTWVCSLKVTDDDGEYAFGRVAVTVKSNPPKVTVQGSPLATGLNEPVTFSVDATDDGSIVSYTWKFGGGEWIGTSTGDTIVSTSRTAGIWPCSLQVADDDGEISCKVVTINVESRPPAVTAGSNVQATGLNDPVTFTGEASDNGTIVLYEWKFGDDDWITVSGGDTAKKSPAQSGDWICILRATDDDGEVACDTVKISITSHPPAVTASSNVGSTGLNDPVEFSGTVSDNEAGLRYFWKFGSDDWVESQTIAMIKNSPGAAGAWVCSLRVIDADGETGSARVVVDVKSSPPTIVSASATPLTTGLNEPVAFLTDASDDGSVEKYEWKFGAGNWVEVTNGDTTATTPLISGAWVCSLKVTDDDGEIALRRLQIAVTSSPPTAQASSNPSTSTGIGESIQFSGSGTDNGSIVSYEWKFGNGNWITVGDGDTTITAPSEMQIWVCSLKVVDDDNEIGYDELSLYVDPATVTDREGNTYSTVRIGDQLWTTQSYRCGTYNDGSTIPHLTDGSEWVTTTDGAYCFYDNTTNQPDREAFGALYNYYAINTGKLAPDGWHVPTEDEYDRLREYLRINKYNYDGSTGQYLMAKAVASTAQWNEGSLAGHVGYEPEKNNSTGLNIYPGGIRNTTGGFEWLHAAAFLATSGGTDWTHYLISCNSALFNKSSSAPKTTGMSVRLVKD